MSTALNGWNHFLSSAVAGNAATWINVNNYSLRSINVCGSTSTISILNTEYTIRILNPVSGIQLLNEVGNFGKIFILLGTNGITSKTLTTLGGFVFDVVTKAP